MFFFFPPKPLPDHAEFHLNSLPHYQNNNNNNNNEYGQYSSDTVFIGYINLCSLLYLCNGNELFALNYD